MERKQIAITEKDFAKELTSSKLQSKLEGIIKPWLVTPNLDGLGIPSVQVIELARASGQSPASVLSWINENQPTVTTIDGRKYQTLTYEPLPEKYTEVTPIIKRNSKGKLVNDKLKIARQVRYPLSKTRELNLNPKRVIYNSRYESRAPGGGPIQKSGFQEKNVSGQITSLAKERARIKFTDTKLGNEIIGKEVEELNSVIKSEKIKFDSVFYQIENGVKIRSVYNQLQVYGEKNKLVLGGNYQRLANQLSEFSTGGETDFLIWNCIGFQWTKEWQSTFPRCTIVENSSESIALYYIERLKQISETLSDLGRPTLTVLLPSNEVLDNAYSKLGLYNQTEEDRRNILQQTKQRILQGFIDADPEFINQIRVLSWEEYLQEKNIVESFNDFTEKGRVKLKSSKNFDEIKAEMLRSATSRFSRKDIRLEPEVLLAIQEAYYSMYVGEGVAFKELAQLGENIIILNFEEMRVPQLEYLGAEGNITILTPVKQNEMQTFYDWKNEQIAARYRQTFEARKEKS